MPAEKTRADSLREYLTGAASAGGAQSDPNASLGKYRSSTELIPTGWVTANWFANVTVDFVALACGAGAATLAASDANTLVFTAPGDSAGPGVAIASGETKIIESADPLKFVRVTRTSAADLSGTGTLTIEQRMNCLWDNVSSTEAAAGDAEVRCVIAANQNSGSIESLKRCLGLLGTTRTTAGGQLSASGAGTITITAGTFADWPASGHAHIKTSAGVTREIVYYTSRTNTVLTVPALGRGRLDTSAAAGASSDLIEAVPGIKLALEFGQIAAAAFTGSGLDDATSGGTFKKQVNQTVRVQIDATGTPDTFKISYDGGSTWDQTGVEITGSAQALGYGLTVTFGATTGHTAGDYWDISATASATDKTSAGEGSIPALTWSIGTTAATGLDIGQLLGTSAPEGAEQAAVWIYRDVPAGATAAPVVGYPWIDYYDAP